MWSSGWWWSLTLCAPQLRSRITCRLVLHYQARSRPTNYLFSQTLQLPISQTNFNNLFSKLFSLYLQVFCVSCDDMFCLCRSTTTTTGVCLAGGGTGSVSGSPRTSGHLRDSSSQVTHEPAARSLDKLYQMCLYLELLTLVKPCVISSSRHICAILQ